MKKLCGHLLILAALCMPALINWLAKPIPYWWTDPDKGLAPGVILSLSGLGMYALSHGIFLLIPDKIT